MKALTIHQPYSELILRGEKRCENRRWWTGYRGPLLVHAGKNREWLASRDPLPKEMDFGALVGVVKVTACVKLEDVGACRQVGFHYRQMHRELAWLLGHPHAEGPYCWILEQPRRFATPIPYRGEQGLFEVPESVFEDAMEWR
jgi:hypothetical protein